MAGVDPERRAQREKTETSAHDGRLAWLVARDPNSSNGPSPGSPSSPDSSNSPSPGSPSSPSSPDSPRRETPALATEPEPVTNRELQQLILL